MQSDMTYREKGVNLLLNNYDVLYFFMTLRDLHVQKVYPLFNVTR